MELGILGLGRMGANMARRLLRAGHVTVVYDLRPSAVEGMAKEGAVGTASLEDLVRRLRPPRALLEDPDLGAFAGRLADSGEGHWTVAAIDEAVPVPVLSTALFDRFSSRGGEEYADKLLSAMRLQFGGHVEQAVAANGVSR